MFVKQKPGISLTAYDLAVSEMNNIHALMDLQQIPRVHDGDVKFSASERVQIYVQFTETMNAALQRKAGSKDHTPH